MAQVIFKKLTTRHYEIIRLAFLGKSGIEIASLVGVTPQAVSLVLRSPLAKAKLADMQARAEESLVNMQKRSQDINDLTGLGKEMLALEASLAHDVMVPAAVRSANARHLADRIIFKDLPTEKTESYRDILRKLDEIQKAKVAVQINVGVPRCEATPVIESSAGDEAKSNGSNHGT